MRLKVIAVVIAILAAPAWASEAWREIPYRELYDTYAAVPQVEGAFIRAQKIFTVRGDAMPLDELRVLIMAEGGMIEVSIAPDGEHNFPLDQALYDENPPIRTNAPPRVLGSVIRYTAEAPPQKEFSYSLAVEMVGEYRAAIRSHGRLARLAMPRPKGLLVKFSDDKPAHVIIGTETLRADEDGTVLIPLRRHWERDPPAVELSRMPNRITLAL
jgi:hypothetical protein